jgi:aldehyde:ferredoxin oxidoreductase
MAATTAKILHVDLTTRTTRAEEIPEPILRRHLGGGGLAAYLLLRDMPPGVDPLGPDNILVFTTSIINGLSLSGTNRYTAAAKSPLTGGYGESEAEAGGRPSCVRQVTTGLPCAAGPSPPSTSGSRTGR